MMKNKYFEGKPNLLRRIMAFITDWYLASLISGIPIMLIYSVESGEASIAPSLTTMSVKSGLISGILAIVIASAYYVLIPIFFYKGQTPGKRLFGIKIIGMDNEDVNFKIMFRREIIGVMLVEGRIINSSEHIRQMITLVSESERIYLVLINVATVITLISICLALFRPHQRMIHDYIANSRVVKA